MAITGNMTINDVITSVEISQDGNEIIRLGYNRTIKLIDISTEPAFSIDVDEFTKGVQVTDLWFTRIAKIPLIGTHRNFTCEFKRKSNPNKFEGSFAFEGAPTAFEHEFDETTGILSVSTTPEVTVTPVEFLTIFGLFRDTLSLKNFPRP